MEAHLHEHVCIHRQTTFNIIHLWRSCKHHNSYYIIYFIVYFSLLLFIWKLFSNHKRVFIRICLIKWILNSSIHFKITILPTLLTFSWYCFSFFEEDFSWYCYFYLFNFVVKVAYKTILRPTIWLTLITIPSTSRSMLLLLLPGLL